MEKRKYRYDLHCHTSEVSKCGKISGRDLAALYKKLGYDGFVVTDHFLNGSNRISKNKLSWTEKIDRFVLGYQAARGAAEELGLTVMFGTEAYFEGANEVLVYGITPEFIYDREGLDKWDIAAWSHAVHSVGGLLSQAHPFRDSAYIIETRLFFKHVDGFEVINASHVGEQRMEFDRCADFVATSRGLIKTAGSDTHFAERPYFSGLEFDHPINDSTELISALRAGEGRPFVIDAEGNEIDRYLRL